MSDKARLLKEIDYEQYVKESMAPEFIESIDHVAGFTFGAETNFLGGWAEDKERRVIFRLQRSLQDALRLSGFHSQSLLETRRFSDGIEFRFEDPDYEFTVSVDGRGRLQVSRRGSTAKRFHEWYRRFMPSLPSIVMETVDTLDEELTGFDPDEADRDLNGDKKRHPVIQVERATFGFMVAVQILPDSAIVDASSTPNIEILNRSLLRRVPSKSGTLTDPMSAQPQEFGRVTYQVNRWKDPEKILETYKVSGPSNNEWRTLVFDFNYSGDTYVPSSGERQPFEQKSFITGGRISEAYLDFFRQRALAGFMKGVLFGVDDGLDQTPRRPSSDLRYSTPNAW
jgi:hypothetical protein